MMTLSLQTPLFSRFFTLKRSEPTPQDDQPAHEAAMAQRAYLAEMMSRSPDAFHSDLDLMAGFERF